MRLLVDHRERLVAQRTRADQRSALGSARPVAGVRDPAAGADRPQLAGPRRRPPQRAEQTARVRIARDELRRIRELTRAIAALEAELAPLVAALAPGLLAERGCGALTAAKLIGEIAGVGRFATDAKLARTAGAAPIPASSGNTDRHRLDRGGNRQLNCALHRLAISKARLDPEPPPTSLASRPRARPGAKRCAASSATSPAASCASCTHLPRTRPTTPGARRSSPNAAA